MTNRDALPLVIAVTGHRDLVADELPGLHAALDQFFTRMRAEHPHRRLRLLTGLAAGGDQLAAEVALSHDIALFAVLPMSREQYAADFVAETSQSSFHSLLASAEQVIELPPARRPAGSDANQRDLQYAQLGVFLCAHCHILLALWDGKPGDHLGGTGQVVRFHHDDVMPGYEDRLAARQQMLIDDESDLVYQIVCSRDRDDGTPADGLKPMSAGWYTKDAEIPRSQTLPVQHRQIFARSDAFSADAMQHAEVISTRCYPLLDDEARSLPQSDRLAVIDRLFCQADVLAMLFQKKTLLATRVLHIAAFLMGLCFLIYADLFAARGWLITFLVLFAFSSALQTLGRRAEWHRKYLDYRALAEGLRVQFYWAAAGVTHESATHFPHDNFLQMQDPELGWIRNVMRVAGFDSDSRPRQDTSGIDYVRRAWIGDSESGQLGYFARGTRLRRQQQRLTQGLGKLSLIVSVVLVAVFIFAAAHIPEAWNDPMLALMGALLLAYAIREGYAYALAESELIKQFRFMTRLYNNSRHRLSDACDPGEQRQILWALGKSALDEHGEWLMLHRNRSVDDAELWRMGG
ncbi:MAG: hypothetical protein AAF290_04650 [Pseudomonadota bacterium]